MDTAADALEEAADKTEVAWATFDETTETKPDRVLIWLGVGMESTVAVATDARELADPPTLLTSVKAEPITEVTANRLKLVEALISEVERR